MRKLRLILAVVGTFLAFCFFHVLDAGNFVGAYIIGTIDSPIITILILSYFLNFGENEDMSIFDFREIDSCEREFVGYDRIQGELYNSIKNGISFIYSGSHRLPNDFYRGILVTGKSGVGKSLMVSQIISHFDVPKYYVDFAYSYSVNPVESVFSCARSEKNDYPCIIFLDSLEKISDEYVGYLIKNMESINEHDIIIVATTNNPDIIDAKLMTFFDQSFNVNLPNKSDRTEIFYEILGHLDIDFKEEDLQQLIKWTDGMTGNDIKMFIYDTYKCSKFDDDLNFDDFRKGLKYFLYGKSANIDQSYSDLKRTAYHEAGHALVDGILNKREIIEIFISPREYVNGAVIFSDFNLVNLTKSEYFNYIDVALGGLVAEEIIFGEADEGVVDDLKFATKYAQDMILKYGMDKDFGPVGIDISDNKDGIYGKKEYVKDSTLLVRKVLQDSYLRVENILKKNKILLDQVAETLLASETKSITGEEFSAIIKENPYVE